MSEPLVIVGRSSSHFTRVARIFAHELGVPYDFEAVHEIRSTDAERFANNPTLRVPSLRTPQGTVFGALNICRELARRATGPARIVWPEDVAEPLFANAQEIVLETMAAEVTVVMARVTGLAPDHPFLEKPVQRIAASVAWLEDRLTRILALLPERTLSFFEVTTFCLGRHLTFREVLSIDDRPALRAFCDAFGERPSARATEYRLDQP